MYNPFNEFLIRTPLLHFNYLNKNKLETALLNQQVQEAIYIASPVLYVELQKYLNGEVNNENEKKRIEFALYRYISRMSSRCTPFGLFAGCSVGTITADKTCVIVEHFNRHTRLDMFFLCTLVQELAKQPDIKDALHYYPNTTLYQIGNKYRYIEYQYSNSQRIHRITSIERSFYLDAILKMAKKGVKPNKLSSYLIDNKIDKENLLDFIQELIDSQILVSEISPSVTGEDFFTKIIAVLEKSHANESRIATLKEIQDSICQLDSNQINAIKLYQDIIRKIEKIKAPYEEKFLFQVDITRNVREATIEKRVTNELQSAMSFLNRITPNGKNETLSQFQQSFYNRYEDREVLLMEALDPEIGIGYPVNTNTGDVAPLLADFHIPKLSSKISNFQRDAFQSVLFKKTMEALAQHKSEIIFTDEDVKKFHSNWADLPSTMYSIFSIVKADSETLLIKTNGFYGTCGANLYARFAHTDKKIAQFVSEITKKEQELMPESILAEIAHLPDSRIGNILSRPHLRDYEILYLANSDMPDNCLIYMSDLSISIRQGKINLRSKKLNKEIIPRLTNAHNYHNNTMPVYQFLCDMQDQNGRGGLVFNWGYLGNELNFLPRVKYKNTIISLATWSVKIEEMKHLFSIQAEDELLLETRRWRENLSLPQKVLLPDGDKELFVDWENELSIQSLFSIIKNRQMVSFKEFLFEPENSVVRDKNGDSYVNECIAAFYRNKEK
ncbi:MAG: lantibiotic dehydratase family protein [Dysgonamonadaceae bacterium]|jgi:hypothetical protein|nr:lantibiotic dehydratase family protein [Dysgonamonadaceae bacterium]